MFFVVIKTFSGRGKLEPISGGFGHSEGHNVHAIPHRGKQAFVLTFTLMINLEKPVDRIHKEETGVPGGKLRTHTESMQTPGSNPATLLTTTPLSYQPFYVDWC